MTTLLLHAPELGNTLILEMMLVYILQLVASEAIPADAIKKNVTVIVQQAELKSDFF